MLSLAFWLNWIGPYFKPGCISIAALYVSYQFYIYFRLPKHESREAHGTAHWASVRDLKKAGLFNSDTGGLWLGRWHGRALRLRTDRHLCTIAPTRSGKGVGAIVPNLLSYPGSTIVIDPKGEAAAIAYRRREEMGQDVHVIDPWRITGLPVSRYNPLQALAADGLDLPEYAAILAEALIPVSVREDSHWDNEARACLAGLIMHVVTSEPEELRNLGQVRHLLTLPPDDMKTLLETMAASVAAEGLVARAAARLMQKSPRERSGVISTAQSATHILDSSRLVASLAKSDFCFGDMKVRPTTVFLVLPADRLSAYGRWLRLLISQALTELIRRPGRPRSPVLVILDEFAALGYLEPVETAMGLLAGFGVQLWPILQNLAQLKANYPDRWPTFLANAGVLQAFGVAETDTADWLSERLGERTVKVRQQTIAGAAVLAADGAGRYSEGYSTIGRPLLTPDELIRLPASAELLLLPGMPPVMANKLTYHRDREFVGKYDANPWLAAAE